MQSSGMQSKAPQSWLSPPSSYTRREVFTPLDTRIHAPEHSRTTISQWIARRLPGCQGLAWQATHLKRLDGLDHQV